MAHKTLLTLDEKKARLKELGYDVFCSLKAGRDSTYTYSINGKNTAEGFDDEGGVVSHIIGKLHLCHVCMEPISEQDIIFLETHCPNHR